MAREDRHTWSRKWFGFWARDQETSEFPTIEDFLEPGAAYPDLPQIADYLRSGFALVATSNVAFPDPIDGTYHPGRAAAIRTDGKWLWVDTLADLLHKYPLVLPDEFVANIRANEYQAPDLVSGIDLELDWPSAFQLFPQTYGIANGAAP